MKIVVIAADEPRDRQRFISKPLRRAGQNVRVVKTRPFSGLLCYLMNPLFKDRPDVILFMGAGVKELLVYGFTKLVRVPVIVRLGGDRLRDLEVVAESLWDNGCYLQWLKYKLDKIIARYFLSRITAAIVVNNALAGKVAKQLKAPGQIFIVTQFCEGETSARNYFIHPPTELLTVVNLKYSEKARGVIWMIEQLNRFVRNNKVNICLRVAGDGLHFKDIENYLEMLDKSYFLTVKLAGFVTELDSYYKRADAFIYRSYHDATPNVILESKRFGLPLLANECEEFNTILVHGVSGLLYRDKKEFSTLLKQLLVEEGLRKKIGQGAQREYETTFSMEVIQEKIKIALMSMEGNIENSLD